MSEALLEKAAARALQIREDLTRRAEENRKRTIETRARHAKDRRKQLVHHSRGYRLRAQKALAGLSALSDIALQPAIQSLIDVQGPLVLWSLEDELVQINMFLSKDELVGIYRPPKGMDIAPLIWRFPYRATDPFNRLQWLRNNVQRYCDLREEMRLWYRTNSMCQPEDFFFQTLVDCSDTEKLERFLRSVIH